jgi:glycosyltransferase involved in cell wall biosynthesis
VYRSHIEIRSDLIRDDSTIQHKVWKILWKYISLCDVFVSHPVEKFIPDDVRKSSMVIKQFPAVTDPCDGLNKKLDDYSTMYYRLLFNRIAYDQLERKVDFARPYFVQISRFDPSKGIPDLINAYIEFRKTMASERHRDVSKLPQLVITGHGSIDDPEGHIIHRDIMDLMETMRNDVDVSDEYVDDIVVVRLGPSDQMLNAVLSGAKAAFQLSLREGFEVKVSEALLKSVPVVAYASGGIPLQVRDGVDGHLVSTGDFRKVAKIMRDITVNDDHYNKLKNRAGKDNREWILTPSNILHWNYIMLNGNEQIPEPIQPNKPGIVPGAVKP